MSRICFSDDNILYLLQEERKRKKAEEEARRKAEKERRRKEAEARAGPKTPNFTIVKKDRTGEQDDEVIIISLCTRKPTIWVSDQVQNKLTCAVTEASLMHEISNLGRRGSFMIIFN